MKNIILLVIGLLISSSAMAGPSVRETVNYINEIINNNQKSSILQVNSTYKRTHYKPVIQLHQKCNVSFSQRMKVRGDISVERYIDSTNLDLEKYKLEYFDRTTIFISDRHGLKSITVKTQGKEVPIYSGERESINTTDDWGTFHIGIKIHGIYAKKMDKALKHLSDICYQKYGSKTKELF